MKDGDQEGLHNALNSDPRILVATTLATLVIAGSAFMWRSNRAFPTNTATQQHPVVVLHKDPDSRGSADSASPGEKHEINLRSPSKKASSSGANAANALHDSLAPDSGPRDLSKNARSKERRRRGKDPMKEILKSGKKVKEFKESNKSTDDGGPTTHQSLSQTLEGSSTHSQRSRDTSLAPSSRSESSCASSTHLLPLSDANPPTEALESTQDGDGRASTHVTTPVISSPTTDTKDPTNPSADSHTSDLSVPSSEQSPRKPNSPKIDLPTCSGSYSSSVSAASDLVATPDTLPSSSDNASVTPTHIQPSQSLPSYRLSHSARANDQDFGPWDWDGTTPPATSDTTFHSGVARVSSKSPTPTPITSSISMAAFISGSHPISSRSSSRVGSPHPSSSPISSMMDVGEDLSLPLTFPTLNTSGSGLSSPGPSRNHVSHSVVGNGGPNGTNGNFGSPRRATTPRRVPTPSSGASTPPPSLSAQTQIASMRGALEAARMREEKTRMDMERYAKEVEMIRWESVAWRRREVELQTQIHHLMHQLQGYAALFASITPQPVPAPNSASSSSANPTSQNGYPIPSSPPAPQSPGHLHMLSAAQMLSANGFVSPPGMLSPMSMTHHSPFFGYPSHLHVSPPQQQPHLHGQPASSHQSNLLSMLFPGGTASGSGSSTTGLSAGPPSPDMNGSPSSAPTPLDRGRRKTRTRTQTANARIGGRDDGWIEGGGEGMDDDYQINDDEYDDDDGLSEALADAILKRPGSIRVKSKKGKADGTERLAELMFPSLSNFGNVYQERQRNGGSMEVLENDVPLSRVGGDSTRKGEVNTGEPAESFVGSPATPVGSTSSQDGARQPG